MVKEMYFNYLKSILKNSFLDINNSLFKIIIYNE